MTPVKEKELLEKYPKIFRQYDLSMTETCMCWGFECGGGWYDIIDDLCQKIQNHVDAGKCDQVEAVQVKEKFGGLRFYVDGGDDKVYEWIDVAEDESTKTCEYCGSSDHVSQSKGSWINTRCKKCMEDV